MLFSLGLAGCPHSAPPAAPAPSADAAALAKLIQLPYRPRQVLFETTAHGSPGLGPTDWSLVALLELEPQDAAALVASSTVAPSAPPPPRPAWLPPGIEVQRSRSLSPDAFRRAPLLQGNLYYLQDSQRFLLVLFTT